MNPPALWLFVPALALLSGARARAGLAEATDYVGPWRTGSPPGQLSPPDFMFSWTDQAVTSLDGVDAAVGPGLAPGQASVSWIETTVTSLAPTTLYFSYRYPGTGFFSVHWSGAPNMALSAFGWKEKALHLPAGPTTVRWEVRLGATAPAYLDQVWTSADPRPRITEAPTWAPVLGTPFSWTVPVASSTPATLTATGLPIGLTVDANTHILSGTPTEAGNFEVVLTALNASGQHVARVRFDIEAGSTGIPEGLDAPTRVFTAGSAWRGVTSIGHDGTDCARGSGTPQSADNSLSTFFNGPGTLSFWYRCEAGEPDMPWDSSALGFIIYAPSARPTQVFKQTTWTNVMVELPAGPQTVEWLTLPAYAPFGASQAPQRFVCLDEVTFVPSTVPPQATFAAWQSAWNVVGQPLTTDTDGDGLTLLMEYAFGGSPYLANRELLPVASVIDGYFTINVTKAPSPTDLTYLVQASKDLTSNAWVTSTVEVLEEDGFHLVAQCKRPVSEQPTSYLRVRVLVDP